MKKMLVKRSKNTTFHGVGDGCLFQFVGRNDKTTYVMVDAWHGKYRKRTGSAEVVTETDDYRAMRDIEVVEVFFMETLTDNCQRGFDALLAKSKETGPLHWFDDLWIHDRNMLSVLKPKVFGWSVRETGTHMMVPNNVYSFFLTEMHKREERDGVDVGRNRFFFWNGQTLKETPIHIIQDRLVDAGCQKARQFSRCAWHVKNSTTLSGEWQKEINKCLEETHQVPLPASKHGDCSLASA
jgi:hypothetical protein